MFICRVVCHLACRSYQWFYSKTRVYLKTFPNYSYLKINEFQFCTPNPLYSCNNTIFSSGCGSSGNSCSTVGSKCFLNYDVINLNKSAITLTTSSLMTFIWIVNVNVTSTWPTKKSGPRWGKVKERWVTVDYAEKW